MWYARALLPCSGLLPLVLVAPVSCVFYEGPDTTPLTVVEKFASAPSAPEGPAATPLAAVGKHPPASATPAKKGAATTATGPPGKEAMGPPGKEAPALASSAEQDAKSPYALALQTPRAYVEGLPKCVCKEKWKFQKYRGCERPVTGCPNKACDGANSPWCLVQNPGCATEEATAGWTFCGIDESANHEAAHPDISDEVDDRLQLRPIPSDLPSSAGSPSVPLVSAATATTAESMSSPQSLSSEDDAAQAVRGAAASMDAAAIADLGVAQAQLKAQALARAQAQAQAQAQDKAQAMEQARAIAQWRAELQAQAQGQVQVAPGYESDLAALYTAEFLSASRRDASRRDASRREASRREAHPPRKAIVGGSPGLVATGSSETTYTHGADQHGHLSLQVDSGFSGWTEHADSLEKPD
eukprot:TRINITY_DN1889_c0_g1_i1.p1 TRINITY_DN1889_c0_g1~~TRINITY_DN1889_c0_g1_i1.p1  ORF type:complete len:414 (-),score=71.79 TRINITY_DN1889_c0_g1_i1:86-1327(-)